MKTNFKKLTSLLLAVVLVFSFTGCSPVKKAEKAVDNSFTAIKNLDKDGFFGNVKVEEGYEEELEKLEFDTEEQTEGDKALYESFKTITSKLEYKILSSEEVDENTIKVKVEATSVDMAPIWGDFFTKIFAYALENAFSAQTISDDEKEENFKKLFSESVTNSNLETVTKQVDITVVKVDNEWKVVVDENYLNAAFGGIYDVLTQMSEQMKID